MNERELFDNVLAIADRAERAQYLDEVCADDLRLRGHIEGLIVAHEDLGGFLESPPVAGPSPTAGEPLAEKPGTLIGLYKLLQQIGEGGMGVVYMAEQSEPVVRRVALKIIKPGMDSRQVIARFEAERQALAVMDHPNVSKVLDAGTTESGRPYFVMELVKGVSITKYCDEHKLSVRERLELFVPVCQAIQHAHQKGIIHRDIKPSNVLVARYDDRAVPKIIDFGVAKATEQRLTEKTVFTQFGQIVGTFEYMSPEQAKLNQLDIDTRSDVYSLGVLLYELLTGETPFDGERLRSAALDELLRIIREEDPPRPSLRLSTSDTLPESATNRQVEPKRLSSLVRGELDWIVMKALEKDRTRRYETATALGADIEHYLADEPVEACPPSSVYMIGKFTRRNKGWLSTAAAVLMTVLVGLTVSTVLIARERDAAEESAEREAVSAKRAEASARREAIAAKEANRRLDDAKYNLYVSHGRLAREDWKEGQVNRMVETLQSHIPATGERDLRGWEWYYLMSLCHRDQQTFRGHTAGVASVSLSPDGQRIASGSHDRTVRIWDLQTAREVSVLYGHKSWIANASWSPDGQRIASGGADGNVIIWDVRSSTQLKVLTFGKSVWTVAWSPDGQRIAAGGIGMDLPRSGDGVVKIWDANSGEDLHTLIGEVGMIRSLAWSPDNRHLVSGENSQGRLQVWKASAGTLVKTLSAHNHFIGSVAWRPDSQHFASASLDQTIKVWNMETWKNVLTIPSAHRGIVNSVSWSRDGTQLVSGGEDGIVKTWDFSTGQQITLLRGHRDSVRSVCWSQDDRSLISGSEDGTIKLWDVTPETEARAIAGQGRVAWSPDGQLLAAGGRKGNDESRTIDVFEAEGVRKIFSLPYEGKHWVGAVAWSPNGQRLAAALAGSGKVVVWDLATRQAILTAVTHEDEARSVAWSPDSRLLASAGIDGMLHLWNVDAKAKILTFREHEDPLGSVLWSPDGERIASASWSRDLKIWDPKTGRVILDLRLPERGGGGQYSIDWSPSGDRLVAGCSSGEIIIWDATTGREVFVTHGHTSAIRAVAWSPDGKRIASGGYDRLVKIWDAESGRELLSLPGHKKYISTVAWSPDGMRLATGGFALKVWDAASAYESYGRPKQASEEAFRPGFVTGRLSTGTVLSTNGVVSGDVDIDPQLANAEPKAGGDAAAPLSDGDNETTPEN